LEKRAMMKTNVSLAAVISAAVVTGCSTQKPMDPIPFSGDLAEVDFNWHSAPGLYERGPDGALRWGQPEQKDPVEARKQLVEALLRLATNPHGPTRSESSDGDTPKLD